MDKDHIRQSYLKYVPGLDKELKTYSYNYCSEGSTAIQYFYLIPIKKLTQLILISWSRWLLQSKLHRKEFRRKKL